MDIEVEVRELMKTVNAFKIKINYRKNLTNNLNVQKANKEIKDVDRGEEVRELIKTMDPFKIKINRKNLNLKKANKVIMDVDREVEVRELMRTMDPFKIKIKFLKNLMINLNLQKINK